MVGHEEGMHFELDYELKHKAKELKRRRLFERKSIWQTKVKSLD